MPSRALLSSLTLLLSLLPISLANRHFDIVNNCPLPINLVINGNVQGSLASGATTTRDLPDIWSGFIYTDFNQGNVDGAGTVRAGFEGPNSYYYIVKDPKWLNVGLQIFPIDRAPKGGFCLSPECEVTEGQCNDAFSSPPSRLPGSNPGVPPPAPLYQCPQTGTLPAGYRVTFCPDGTIPNYQTRPNNIQPKRDPQNKCLDVQGGVLANGTPVQIYECNGTTAQKWVIKRGGQQIKLSGTDYCLDAGSNPASGVKMKIWQCLSNVAAQQWTYTSDDTIILTGTGQCLDLTDGNLANGNRVQTWACQSANDNQVWII
ncbi:G-X-X-X-Q-X-W domain-containing protein [Ephemerocybe angulata]|uniref:G-X-X-X-Q-X-W domain-containing protein n=1 Tax=Ephemerocybe angulata TaxID=980116 RepID=A0A8H6LX64_9AGAR|nr:G-X-X-X-Q-X-W domain-containing protein [Tulosesus angulatus]